MVPTIRNKVVPQDYKDKNVLENILSCNNTVQLYMRLVFLTGRGFLGDFPGVRVSLRNFLCRINQGQIMLRRS